LTEKGIDNIQMEVTRVEGEAEATGSIRAIDSLRNVGVEYLMSINLLV
jgi:hypothetical protein